MIEDNFISEDEENKLLEEILNMPFNNDLKRRTQHYGYKYPYTKNPVSLIKCDPIPNFLNNILTKLNEKFNKSFDQIIINEYLPGQGIFPHIDNPKFFGDTIISLSLGSDILMVIGDKEIDLPKNSILILQEEFRYSLKHGIVGRKKDIINGINRERHTRISITFREVLK